MSTVFILILAILVVSTITFVVIKKTKKVSKFEIEPLGYETTAILEPIVEEKKTAKIKTSKNTAKNKSLAKMEAKPKKTTKKTK